MRNEEWKSLFCEQASTCTIMNFFVLFLFDGNLIFFVRLVTVTAFYFLTGCHECEIMKEGQGVAESEFLWKTCEKNPKHEKFIPFHNDLNIHTALLPHRIHGKGHRHIKAAGDLVVRLRVQWTSPDRPDDDDLSSYRGTGRLRLGSGFIQSEDIESESSGPCPCGKCDGASASRSWIFSVWTACHVVYNTEEAKRVKVDLFYDDENSELEGRMKSLWPVSVKFSNPNLDICEMACVTHDEKLAERIISIERNMDREIFSHLDLRPLLKNDLVPQLISEPSHGGQKLAVCISHPHGQPKMLTIGKVISCEKGGILKYDTPTCPGSSGGPVFVVDETYSILWLAHAHTGVHRDKPRKLEGHINYCNMLGYRM